MLLIPNILVVNGGWYWSNNFILVYHWSHKGRIIEVTLERGFIDFGIQRFSTVEQVIQTHRRKQHRSEIFNKIKEIIETQRRKQHVVYEDMVLWRSKGDKFALKFVSKKT